MTIILQDAISCERDALFRRLGLVIKLIYVYAET